MVNKKILQWTDDEVDLLLTATHFAFIWHCRSISETCHSGAYFRIILLVFCFQMLLCKWTASTEQNSSIFT